MAQAADQRPDPTPQRKAAIAYGGALDHTGDVDVRPISDFDLNRTIFQTLEGKAARFIIRNRIAKEVSWRDEAEARVRAAYEGCQEPELPALDPELLSFLVNECDFDVEHADGSFLDHLYFCFEYTARHYPGRSALVMLLHSILGTGTNTFAMEAEKIPALRALLGDFDWCHVEAFPSVLRLLYHGPIRAELRREAGRSGSLKAVRMHRVIDNERIELTGQDFWVAANYQLIHLIDFLPVSNWSVHQNDTSFILFRDLHELLNRSGQLEANVAYVPSRPGGGLEGEEMTGLLARLTTRIPVSVAEKMAGKSVARFSERIGHSLDYELVWD